MLEQVVHRFLYPKVHTSDNSVATGMHKFVLSGLCVVKSQCDDSAMIVPSAAPTRQVEFRRRRPVRSKNKPPRSRLSCCRGLPRLKWDLTGSDGVSIKPVSVIHRYYQLR